MEILKTVDVQLTGTNMPVKPTVPFYMAHEGKRFFVNIPNIPEVIEAFKWMGEANVLEHLVALEPKFETNDDEVQAVLDHNQLMLRHAIQYNSMSKLPISISHSPGNQYTYAYPGEKKVPDSYWTATWTFWEPSSAVLMKLALEKIKCHTQ